MALSFPDTPTVGQEVYSDTKRYTWDGVKWKLSPIAVDWVRPTDWLPMPTVLATEQKFVGLHAVFPHDAGLENSSNFVAIQVASTASYTIDWGDNTSDTGAIGTTVFQHTYDYNSSNIPSNTLSSRGYKQVKIIVTPVTGNITSIKLNVIHSLGLTNINSNWLDIICSLPNATSFTIGMNGTPAAPARLLESVNILSLGGVTSYEGMFAGALNTNSVVGCSSLKTVTMPTSVPTLVSTKMMFQHCPNLTTVNLFDTSNVTDCSNMFNGCRSVKIIPNYNIGKATILNSMFGSCSSLTSVPLLNISANTALAINANSMFNNCVILPEIPLLNFSNNTNFSNIFNNCPLLKSIPAINTSNGILFDSMFQSCADLPTIPTLDFSKGTSFTRLYQEANALQTAPTLNLVNVIPAGMFNFNSTNNLADYNVINCKYSLNISAAKLTQKVLTTIMSNLLPLPTIAVSFAGTGVQATSIVTAVGHGLVNTAPIKFQVITTTTGITVGTTYYVINATTDTFQVSLTSGGVAVIFGTGNGTGTCSLNSTITLSNNVGSQSTLNQTSCTTITGSKSITINSGGSLSAARFLAGNILYIVNLNPPWILNQKITFRTVGTSGLGVNTIYYVVSINSSSTFQISTQANGTPISFTSGGSDGAILAIPIDSQVTGTGSPLTTPIVTAFTSNTVVLTNHQLQTNDIVSFPVVTNNLITYTPYYIVGTPNANDFQISTTLGGTALTFTDGTGTMLYDSVLESISGGAGYPYTLTMSRPMTSSATSTLVFRPLKTSIALFKNWTVA